MVLTIENYRILKICFFSPPNSQYDFNVPEGPLSQTEQQGSQSRTVTHRCHQADNPQGGVGVACQCGSITGQTDSLVLKQFFSFQRRLIWRKESSLSSISISHHTLD